MVSNPSILIVDTLLDETDGSVTDGDISLRDALAVIPDGGMITFADDLITTPDNGIITLALGELLIDKSVTIDGDLNDDGIPDITIDANEQSRVFNIDDGNSVADKTIKIEGLIITGGAGRGRLDRLGRLDDDTDLGGGIRTLENLTVSKSTISGNVSGGVYEDYYVGVGGGIYSRGGTLEVISSTISSNIADSGEGDPGGGGISHRDGDLIITNSVITDNTATIGTLYSYGGGIYHSGGDLTLSDSIVSRNSASNGVGIKGDRVTVINSIISDNNGRGTTYDGRGGGIFGNTVTVTDSTISGNSTGYYGGGIFGSTVTVTDSTISGNSSEYDGGGISSDYVSSIGNTVTVTNSTISGNSSGASGGGINVFSDSILTVTNSTISGNSSRRDGGGISFPFNDTGTVNNSIVAGNNATTNPDVVGTFTSNGANIIGDATGSTGFDPSETFASLGITDISEVIDTTLRDNGGLTLTHALVQGSPAIDGGINADAIDENGSLLSFDQRGDGFNRNVNGTVDIGAYEEQDTVPVANAFFFSVGKDAPGLGNTEDIIQFDGSGFSILFDGSSLGLASTDIDAFDIINETEILMSFANEQMLDGLGLVDDSDIVKFNATSLGEGTTAGTFEMIVDGSALELTNSSEDIDAITGMEDGSILFSVTGSASLFDGQRHLRNIMDEDLIHYDPSDGLVSLYFDGSDVKLTKSKEDVNGVSLRDGELLFSTVGNFSTTNISGQEEDIFSFTPSSIGSKTAGTFASELFADGSELGITENINALDYSIGLD